MFRINNLSRIYKTCNTNNSFKYVRSQYSSPVIQTKADSSSDQIQSIHIIAPTVVETVESKQSKPKKPKFERTPDHEVYLSKILSNELSEAESIIKKFSEELYSVSSQSYNLLLSAWLKNGDLENAQSVWLYFPRYGVSRSVRSYSLMINGLIHQRRSALLPKYIELLEKSKIKPARILADRISMKESIRIPYTLSDVKSMDPKVCIKLPKSCPRPDGTFYNPVNLEQEKTQNPRQKQFKSERSRIDESIRVYSKSLKHVNELGRSAQMRPARDLMIKWFNVLCTSIEELQKKILRNLNDTGKVELHQLILTKIKADKLSVIVMHEVLSKTMVNIRGVPYTTITAEIGRAIQAEVRYNIIKRDLNKSQQKWVQKRAKNTYARLKSLTRFEFVVKEAKEAELEAIAELERESQAEAGQALVKEQAESKTEETTTKISSDNNIETTNTKQDTNNVNSNNDTIITDTTNKEEKSTTLSEDTQKSENNTTTTTTTTTDNTSTNNNEKVKEAKKEDNPFEELSELKDANWSSSVSIQVGSSLVSLFIENCTISQCKNDIVSEVPAFIHEIVKKKKKSLGVIKPHEEVISQLDPEDIPETAGDTKLLPMYIAPRPWLSSKSSPYLHAKVKIMRTYSQNQNDTLKTADLSEVCELLTMLGKVPWKINQRVFDVVKEGWERGGNLPYVPARQNIKVPPTPEDFRENPETRLIWRREKHKTNQKNQERYSLRCDFTLKKNTAEILEKEDEFYFPHNMDFRGRCYPIPPHLNHIGSDLSRGILQFAEGKPLGERGLYWLKVHLASLYGVNKVSFADRVKFTDDHLNDIIDSAENPLDGNRWWLEGDDAWQALGCCFELRDAYRLKDPTKYVSHMPIHMDGSCNGLQHYAALGGDVDGGRSVNLLPADTPQDVYTHVLNIVKKQVEEDAAKGEYLAQKLVGNIVRKTIKQTVMTSVYGVTKIGARKQISGQLKDQGCISDEDLFKASVYLTNVTFNAMQTMFTGARQIMAWLSDTARAVSRTGTTMAWKTPIGIPVEQHYRRPGRQLVKTLLQNIILAERVDDLPVLVQKQRTAFPPNYVHSLDSTHMFKTAKACNDSGICFAAVHDSYWTHASTVDPMNVHLRNAFVELHTRPLLQELVDQIAITHPELKLSPVPQRGPLDITLVKDSTYFFH